MHDISGRKFGRLEAISFLHKSPGGFPIWHCRCECGGTKDANFYNLVSGKTQSCGCLQKERASVARKRHGMIKHPAYRSWSSMLSRCNNPNHEDFEHYGARGICVCPDWHDFLKFWADMGPLWQEGLSIDRKDNDGDYEPNNCHWVTQKHQVRNRRNTRYVETPWGRMSMAEAAERAGLRYGLFVQRVRAGWSQEELFSPRMRRAPA